MSKFKSIRRYQLLIERTEKTGYPSMKDLISYLKSHEINISERTAQRDLQNLRNEFGVEIKYELYKNGYHIAKDQSLDIPNFLRFLELVNTANILSENLARSRHALDYISFEQTGELRGTENLKEFLNAIHNRRVITFEYENFVKNEVKERVVHPYMLKAYQNRWYLIGTKGDSDEVRSFGIDRISDFKKTTEVFKARKDLNIRERFRHIIGLHYSTDEPTEIKLWASHIQTKYLKSLPLHLSQTVIEENADGTVFGLRIQPNYEFYQKIWALSEQVELLEPRWVRDRIKKALENTTSRYEE